MNAAAIGPCSEPCLRNVVLCLSEGPGIALRVVVGAIQVLDGQRVARALGEFNAMSTIAVYVALKADLFEARYLHYPMTISEERWGNFRAAPGRSPDVMDEAQLIAERCKGECTESRWTANTPGSIRRLLSAQPPLFKRAEADPVPVQAAWGLLRGTLGAAPTREHPLPWWVEASYPPQDHFVGLTPPFGLLEVIESTAATNLLEIAGAIIGADPDDKDDLPDLKELCGFLTQASHRGNWVLGVESAT